jgi:hypothetical protein
MANKKTASKPNTLLVSTADTVAVRGRTPKELPVEILAENVNVFLGQVERMLEKAPETVGKFQFTEFTVSAEISAKGGLVLLGSGVEVEGKGGLTFKFQRK